jgi:transcriptional regulator with XRE-family HTH domain
VEYEGWRVGPNLQALRKEKNMTAAELSDQLGVSTSHVSQIEQGCRRMSMDLLYKYMEVLAVDANTVLDISLQEKKEPHNSIDQALAVLPEAKRRYLTALFAQMIQTLPS